MLVSKKAFCSYAGMFWVFFGSIFSYVQLIVSAEHACMGQDPEVEFSEKSESTSVEQRDTFGQDQLSQPHLSPNIKCFVFPRGDITRFKPARCDY